MNKLLNITRRLLDEMFFEDCCAVYVSENCLEAINNNRLRVSIKKIGRGQKKLRNFEVVLRHTSGVVSINTAAGEASVTVDEDVHGKFDLRLYRNSEVVIGQGTTSGSTTIFCKDSSFRCGRDCMFSTDVVIQSSDQHGIVDLTAGKIVNGGKKVVNVGDHVWLGRAVTLTSNAAIGDGSLIAIGAVVTNKIPENVIAGGVPAKVLKSNHTWCRSPDFLDEYSSDMVGKVG